VGLWFSWVLFCHHLYPEPGIPVRDITNGNMALNDVGHIVEKCWQDIPVHFPHADLDEFIVMPNHFHGILVIKGSVGAYKHTPQRSDQSVQSRANIYSPLVYYSLEIF
jgi:hypothetical protein